MDKNLERHRRQFHLTRCQISFCCIWKKKRKEICMIQFEEIFKES